jgi:hypothetical protein
VNRVELLLAGGLGHEAQLRAGLGLEPKHELVGLGNHPAADAEAGWTLEHDADPRHARRHRLARPDVERHAGPAPVLDVEPQCGERFGL